MPVNWRIHVRGAAGAIFMMATVCAAAGPTESSDKLLQLLRQYRLLQTMHVKMTTVIDYKTIPPGIFHVEGTQEYWADGPKFRVLQLMNSSVFPGMSHDVRWDGEHYQWFNVNDSTLIVSRKSRQKTPFVGEPIALLPLEFLNPGGDELGVKLSFADLVGEEVRSQCDEIHVTQLGNSAVEIPGGEVGTFDTTFRLAFGGPISYLPTTIRRVSSTGVELNTDEIQYGPIQCGGETVYLPSWARMTVRTTDGRVVSVATCTVTLIEANKTIPSETFTIDYQTAKRVIDIDRPVRNIANGNALSAGSTSHIEQLSLDENTPSITDSVDTSAEIANARSTGPARMPWTTTMICAMSVGLALLTMGTIVTFRATNAFRGDQ